MYSSEQMNFNVHCHGYLENRPMEEESEQLNEVKEDVAIFLLHADDVGQGEGPIGVDASVGRGGPGEEAKLEKVLHHNSQLRETENRILDYASAETMNYYQQRKDAFPNLNGEHYEKYEKKI